MPKEFQVVGIGNAIVDIFAHVNESFLKTHNIEKSVMNLTGYEKAQLLLDKIKISGKVAGGSAANTIVGLAQLGLKTGYIGKVCDDDLGHFFSNDLIGNQVSFVTQKYELSGKLCTGHCIVLITPDGERTMNTCLGVTEFLTKDDLDKKFLRNCDWLYLEGYRYDGKDSKIAFSIAISETKRAGGKIAISLSDPFCVERHRKEFLDIIKGGIDVIFCNEYELISLTEQEDLDSAMRKALDFDCNIVCTAALRGAFVTEGSSWIHIETKEIRPFDTTGAGDFFATGFIFGLVNGWDNVDSGRLGNRFASQVIQTIGCRLDKSKMLELRK